MQREAYSVEHSDDSGGAMSFDRAISAVLKRARLVLAFPILLAAIVAIVVMLIPNRYDASALVQIDPRQKSITNIDGVIPDMKGDTPSVESEVEIVQSRPIVLKVIEVLDLRNDPEFSTPTLTERISSLFGLSPAQDTSRSRAPAAPPDGIAEILDVDAPGQTQPRTDEIADAFIQKLRVSRVRNTLLIEIRFSARDAAKAARIANTVAEVYLQDQIESRARGSATAARMLESKIDEMRRDVATAERKVEQWKADHSVYDSEGQELSEKQLARLMEQTVIAKNATSEARAKYEHAQSLARRGDAGTTLADVLQSPTVRLLKEQLANATRKCAELGTKYGPKHPEILKANAERADAQAQLNAEIARLIDNLKNEVQVAESRERQLAQTLNDLKEQQVVTKDRSFELKALERDAATSKQLFEALLARYKQTSETQGFQLPDVRIIEKADAPLFPASPKRRQLILMSAIAGTILGIAVALLFELLSPGLTRRDDIERVFDMAHLSSVPTPAGGRDGMSPAKAIRLIVAEPLGPYADAIRNTRRELDMRRPSPDARIVLVASSIAGEGAETIASNLAHNYAMTGNRTLLIDGDARLQPLTRQLATDRSYGMLDQALAGRPFQHAVLHDQVTGLNFLPAAGPGPLSLPVPEIINATTFATALAALKSEFDTIVVSAPPLLPVIDGRILADYADQIVFVIAWQKTPRQLAKAAIKTLGINDPKLAGVVLNDVAPEALDEARGFSGGLAGGLAGSLFGVAAAARSAGARRYTA